VQHPSPDFTGEAPCWTAPQTKFSHVKPGDTDLCSGGLRDFFLYRDLGVAEATHGKVIAHLVKANMAPETGTGWHRHEADFQIVIMTKGWARFMYEDKETLVEAGDVVHQRPGIRHYLFDYSPDMEYLEIVSPGRLQDSGCGAGLRHPGANTLEIARMCADNSSDTAEPAPPGLCGVSCKGEAAAPRRFGGASELGVEFVDFVGFLFGGCHPFLHGGQLHDAFAIGTLQALSSGTS
jgi:quercetin dioxygenase-like cupin family protein